jgi:hypothetical protein
MLEPMSADPWSCAVRTERTPDGHR